MNHSESALLRRWAWLLKPTSVPGPVQDVACGDGRNGIFLAQQRLEVICCDRSRPSLRLARRPGPTTSGSGCGGRTPQSPSMEARDRALLPENVFGAVLVFRYLHNSRW